MARKCRQFRWKRIRGHKRRVCVSYGKKGRKRRSTKRRRSTSATGSWRRVSKTTALKRNGKLKKGCKFGRNGQAYCRGRR